jgi:formylglycine-generating enzyme required for sulfatase activity
MMPGSPGGSELEPEERTPRMLPALGAATGNAALPCTPLRRSGRVMESLYFKLHLENHLEEEKMVFTVMRSGFLVFTAAVLLAGCSGKVSPGPDSKPVSSERMVFIRGGSFEMGDHFGDGNADETPIHRVTVRDFYLSETEVTVGEYRKFCMETGKPMPPEPSWGWISDHPIVNVSWHDAMSFCEWLSEQTGRQYRLPSEAEWEYAARNGGKGVRFPTGDTLDREDENVGNYERWRADETKPGTTPVGSYPPSTIGLYDLAGNVHEWVFDLYDSEYYARSPGTNPTGPLMSGTRVERGGSWRSPLEFSRSANRNHADPTLRVSNLGFRLCMSAF